MGHALPIKRDYRDDDPGNDTGIIKSRSEASECIGAVARQAVIMTIGSEGMTSPDPACLHVNALMG